MANYPKTRTKVKMTNGWERAAKPLELPNTTKYIRWYGNTRVDLFHKRGSKKYTYILVRMGRNGTSFKEFHFNATTLQRAQEHVDLIMTELMTE